ncbi:MAG: glycine cleavage system protein T [Candidatus Bathyarchaeota archaeon B26-1]|nr:MAG: glycine cleavage system protein T [Candidatus Bathyarchaeota archaeon B26-1]
MMKRTPFFKYHEKFGRLGEFAGYEMPLWYKGPSVEHMSVREKVGLFDVSHMGRIIVRGTHAQELLERLLTNDCRTLKPMECHLSVFCNESGGTIDDIMVTKLSEEEFLLTVNAANREKDLRWLREHRNELEVEIIDVTEKVPMIAVQGPLSLETVQRALPITISDLKRLHAEWFSLGEKRLLISRTGYTGEDGFELYLFEGYGCEEALTLWNEILEAGGDLGIEACGLASRDTLRIEAGFCLYGNELDTETSPVEAGLKFAVKLDGRSFIGREALEKQIEEGTAKTRVGFKLLGRGIPRKGMAILAEDGEIGRVTSGTFSPLLKVGIGMGYVPPEYSKPGTEVAIEIRGRPVEAVLVKFPFYDKEKYGWARKG